MTLRQLITPKNEDGSIDHRYQSISNEICELAGKQCLAMLEDFFNKTSQLESENGGAALHLVRKSFEIDMDEYQRKRVTKALSNALKELGFKPSKVSKIMNAGRFLQSYDWFEEGRCYFGSNTAMTGQDFVDKLSEYFDGYGIGSLDVLSRTSKQGRKKAYRHFVKEGTRMSQKILEDLQRQHPTNPNERRGRKSSRAGFPETRPTYALATHGSLEVMDDAKEASLAMPPELGQKLVSEFIHFVASGALDQCLSRFSPVAQAHLIDEVEAVQILLEEFVSTNKPIEITPIH